MALELPFCPTPLTFTPRGPPCLQWGTVSKFFVTEVDATVVCRQLGISNIGTFSTAFAGGNGPIWLARSSASQTCTGKSQREGRVRGWSWVPVQYYQRLGW